MASESQIAIVGIGGIFPGAPDLDTFWNHVKGGVDASSEVPPRRWAIDPSAVLAPGIAVPDKVYTSRGYYVDRIPIEIDGLNLSPDFVARLDPVFQLIVTAGKRAWDEAVTTATDRSRVGIILGHIALPTEKASALAVEILGRTFAEKANGADIRTGTDPLNRYVAGLPAGILAKALGLGGGTYTLDAACASSLYAVKLAANELRSGRADLMLTGGAARPDCLYTQMGFAQLRALSISGRCSPFDAAGDGLMVGEGCGVLALKRLADAERDADRIYAILAGIGLSNDVEGSLLAPASEGQLRAMRAAYREANWNPSDVDLIECHATGTPVGDAIEFASLNALWNDEPGKPGRCVIGSVKSSVGHLLTGAGAAALIKVLLAMKHGVLPPTANFRTPGKQIQLSESPFRILGQAEPWIRRGDAPRRAAVSGFGFGGINAHVLLEEYQPQHHSENVVEPRRPAEPIAIVGTAARFGPWQTLPELRARLLGGGLEVHPARHSNWWGIRESHWYQNEYPDPNSFLGYFIDHLDIAVDQFRIPPNELREMLPQQLLALQTAAAALNDAKNWEKHRSRAGVFLGLGLDLNTTNYHFRWTLSPADRDAGHPALNANRTMGALGSIAASRIARAFRFEGPSFTVCSEESSGGRALEVAVRALQRGELDLALTGAVDFAGDPRAMLAASGDRSEDVGGEGAACFVLKRLSDAERDGDRIYSVVRGIGIACGGVADSASPDRSAICKAVRRASFDAGIDSASTGLIVTDGHAEMVATDGDSTPVLTSAASDIGHAGAASFAASLLKACFALDHDILPPIRASERRTVESSEHFRILPEPQFWLANRDDLPRRAGVTSVSVDGNCVHVILEEHAASKTNRPEIAAPLGPLHETVFAFSTDSASGLRTALAQLTDRMSDSGIPVPVLGLRHWSQREPEPGKQFRLALVARTRAELSEQLVYATDHVATNPEKSLPHREANGLNGSIRDRVFYSPSPLAERGDLAFVFPGSGSHFAGMGRDLAVRWPNALQQQQLENTLLRDQFSPDLFWNDRRAECIDPRAAIFGQVTLATLVTDVLAMFGVRPRVAIGYSLGESAALFSLRAWTDRDEMYRRMQNSTLFVSDLASPFNAARSTWKLPPEVSLDWLTGVFSCRAEQVRSHLRPGAKVYLQIVNTPDECVIGGQRGEVESLVKQLGGRFLPLTGVTIAHCDIVKAVAKPYRDLHVMPTHQPEDVRFYSGATGRSYLVNSNSAADAILGHASATIDFPRVVESAYADGVRLFAEIGPGGSCSRMIDQILVGRPHIARSACVARSDSVSTLLRLLAQLFAEGVPVNFAPLFDEVSDVPRQTSRVIQIPVGGKPFVISSKRPSIEVNRGLERAPGDASTEDTNLNSSIIAALPQRYAETVARTDNGLLDGWIAARSAASEAHGAFLRFAESGSVAVANLVAFHQSLIPQLIDDLPHIVEMSPIVTEFPSVLDTDQCFEFAHGSIGKSLGSEFAMIDTHPTRVRLPDGPLMLVDRILNIEGEARSMGAGRVITEHAVHSGRWYLTEGRIPTSIAVESGQADLFLSAYLGIDFITKGLAVYRLLDAVVTFHDHLPQAEAVIRYDIHIDRFFRQGETHLFRFRFEGTVNGKLLLSMSNGCAGFFTAEELAAGRGIVQTALDRRPMPGKRPADWREFVPLSAKKSYDEHQLDALRAGDLVGCFGEAFAHLPLAAPLTLPGGMLKLVDRVTEIDPTGGRFGMGRIRAEMDIHPDDWFLTCHFVDDMVMPGTLMYECCLHTLRVFLLRIGWIGEKGVIQYEPIPEIASQLKCRGQVTAATRTVLYEVSLKEIGYRPEPFAVCDALMYADGKPIVEITNMTLRMTGTTKQSLEQMWESRSVTSTHATNRVLFDRDRITAFAIGKPSDAFGDRYQIFDNERIIARLPGPPFQFLDRITQIRNCKPWVLEDGAEIVAEYDIPPDAWYFASNRQPTMPFAVLLEIALQPCGWLAGYLGSALTSPTDLSFRNLGGSATQFEAIDSAGGTLAIQVKMTKVSTSGGMIIQNYDFRVTRSGRTVYQGDTYFGFFSKASLEQQVGIRDAKRFQPIAQEASRGKSFPISHYAPFPDERMRMVDEIDLYVPDGGLAGLGFIRGSKRVNPADWFFKAHFYQDPVWPGSLGLEAFLQLLKVIAADRWGADPNLAWQTVALGARHTWVYRGQVLPTNHQVEVEAVITGIDDATRTIRADGFLCVDGRTIYSMTNFTLRG